MEDFNRYVIENYSLKDFYDKLTNKTIKDATEIVDLLNRYDKEYTQLTKLYNELNKKYCEQLDELINVKHEKLQLTISKKELAINEIERIKKYWNWYKNTEYKKGLLMDYFIDNLIKDLKENKN